MNPSFPATQSVVCTQALGELVLPRYGLNDAADVRFYQSGFNDTYVASMRDGAKYYIRVYRRGWRTREDALCELDALNHLRAKGFPAAYPVPREDGGFLTTIAAPEGDREVAVFVEAKGSVLKYGEDSASLCVAYGKAVAAMHTAWDDFASPHARFRVDLEHLIDGPVRRVEPFLAHRPSDLDDLKRFASAVRDRIATFPDLEVGYCHGDLLGFHAHRDERGMLTFYDFDCGGFGFRSYDLAVFRWSFRFDNQEMSRWEPFLQAYRIHRQVADSDVDAVLLFVCARHVWHMGVRAECAGMGVWRARRRLLRPPPSVATRSGRRLRHQRLAPSRASLIVTFHDSWTDAFACGR